MNLTALGSYRTMIRQSLTYLLAALIALQSVVAMADAHQLHQSATEHLTFEHKHDQAGVESPKLTELQKVDSVGGNPPDCNHCCHCHGMAHFYLAGSQEELFTTAAGDEISDHRISYHSYAGSPDNPPPID